MKLRKRDILLPVEVAGVRFRNPFYVASGPTTMTVEQLIRIEETGWGGASLKLAIDPKPYINRHPRYAYYGKDGILSFTTERRLTFDEGLRLMEAGRRSTSEIVLFSNITYAGSQGVEGWVNMARKFEAAGAHVNELNMCCPNMSYNVELSEGTTGGPRTGASLGQELELVREIVRAVKAETGIPLFVKLTPEGGGIARVAQACYQAGADAVGTTANRLAIHHVNLDDPSRSPVMLQEEVSMHCMSSSWVHPLGLRDVYEIRRLNGPSVKITGTGGVRDWRSAAEMFLCGANLIGICAETLISGFGFLPGLVRDFKAWFEKQKYSSVEAMTGVIPSKITAAPDVTLHAGHAHLKDINLVAPCVHACPASVPAQGYISRGGVQGSLRTADGRQPPDVDLRLHLQPSMRRVLYASPEGRSTPHPGPEAFSGREGDETQMENKNTDRRAQWRKHSGGRNWAVRAHSGLAPLAGRSPGHGLRGRTAGRWHAPFRRPSFSAAGAGAGPRDRKAAGCGD
jgi:dihydroorotate dehydrogenase